MNASRRARVLFDGQLAGWLTGAESGFEFSYELAWLANPAAQPVSLTMPLSDEVCTGNAPRAFFLGLLPEGWLFDMAIAKLKVSPDDAFGLVIALCGDCPGAVSVEAEVRDRQEDEIAD